MENPIAVILLTMMHGFYSMFAYCSPILVDPEASETQLKTCYFQVWINQFLAFITWGNMIRKLLEMPAPDDGPDLCTLFTVFLIYRTILAMGMGLYGAVSTMLVEFILLGLAICLALCAIVSTTVEAKHLESNYGKDFKKQPNK